MSTIKHLGEVTSAALDGWTGGSASVQSVVTNVLKAANEAAERGLYVAAYVFHHIGLAEPAAVELEAMGFQEVETYLDRKLNTAMITVSWAATKNGPESVA